jgi:hypothetical protein
MTIFLILNGMGFVFMLYVLVNFVKEGRRMPRGGARMHRLRSFYASKANVFVATRPVKMAGSAPEGTAVIPFPALEGRPRPVEGQPAPDGGKPSQRKYSVG